jgi:hypothetical protein
MCNYLFIYLHLFCVLFDMKVNVRPHKTCVVVYGKPVGALPVWTLGGQAVPVCDGYTDLGVKCTSARGMQAGAAALAVGGRRAMHAALSMCRRAKLTQPAFKLRLFDALVEPVLSYGCQVWGPWAWSIRDPLGSPAEKVHLDYLRIMSGAGKKVKQQLLMRDFARARSATTGWPWPSGGGQPWCWSATAAALQRVHCGMMCDSCCLVAQTAGRTVCWRRSLVWASWPGTSGTPQSPQG